MPGMACHSTKMICSTCCAVKARSCWHLQMFNSRMCQLVLGAGAVQMAGLKSITAKHLALSCQCLGALAELHPALAGALASKLPVARRALLTPELGLVLQVSDLHCLSCYCCC